MFERGSTGSGGAEGRGCCGLVRGGALGPVMRSCHAAQSQLQGSYRAATSSNHAATKQLPGSHSQLPGSYRAATKQLPGSSQCPLNRQSCSIRLARRDHSLSPHWVLLQLVEIDTLSTRPLHFPPHPHPTPPAPLPRKALLHKLLIHSEDMMPPMAAPPSLPHFYYFCTPTSNPPPFPSYPPRLCCVSC